MQDQTGPDRTNRLIPMQLPIHEWVMMGPTMCHIPWNNIEIDSLQGTLRLLEDRLQCLVMILQECMR